jgi:hypothetical protein
MRTLPTGRGLHGVCIRLWPAWLLLLTLGLSALAQDGKVYANERYRYEVRLPPHWYVTDRGTAALSMTDFRPERMLTGGMRPARGVELIIGPLAAWGETRREVNTVEDWIRYNTRHVEVVSRTEIPPPASAGWGTKSCVEVISMLPVAPRVARDRVVADYCLFRGEPFRAAIFYRENDPRGSEFMDVLHRVLDSVHDMP